MGSSARQRPISSPVKWLLENMLMPPTGLYLMVLAGLVLRWRARRPLVRGAATALAASGALLSVTLSLPLVSFLLLDGLQSFPSLDPAADSIDADVIVVLAGDVDCDPPEYGSDQPGALSQLRCRYGAHLSRRTGLPLVITGGVLRPDRRPASHVLRDYVEDELGVTVAWTEDDAKTTRGNARGVARLMNQRGYTRAAVVTNAWHMPRSVEAFEREGVDVLPAPTGAHPAPSQIIRGLIPRARSMRDSSWALHEYVGMLWYRISD